MPITCILTPDTRQALLAYAGAICRLRPLEVIAVTGSSGKTTAKELIAASLTGATADAADGPVFRNPHSFNGRFGLPIALGRLQPWQRRAVLELAADEFGEIALLAQVTRPTVGLITAVHESHLDVFGSLDAIAREKGALLTALPATGLALLNADDPRVLALAPLSAAPVLTVGLSAAADVRGVVRIPAPIVAAADAQDQPAGEIEVTFSPAAQARLPLPAAAVRLPMRLLGDHQAPLLLAALAVGLFYGQPLDAILAGLAACRPLPGRLRPLPGLAGAVLLDDSANANPASMQAALTTLAAAGRPAWAILGDIGDLGAHEVEAHRRLGSQAAGVVGQLIAIGDRSRRLAEAAAAAGLPAERIFHTYSKAEAVRHVQEMLAAVSADPDAQPPVILIKGGRALRLEEVVAGLLAPAAAAQASALLVRQDAGWRQVRLARPDRPTWLEVDLEAIADNLRILQQVVGPGVDICAVLKADGYGHGAVRVARTVLNNGARLLAVACLAEAITLRRAGIAAPILILGYTPPWQARDVVLNRVTPTVFDLDFAQALQRAVSALDAGQPGRSLRTAAGFALHVKVDTGMARLGLEPDAVMPFIQALHELPDLFVEGIFTHFATADSADQTYLRWQLGRFQAVLEQLTAQGLRPPCVHAANSAATLTLPASHFDLVRTGIALYGLQPGPETPLPPGMRPALRWKSTVAQVKRLPAGAFVSYGAAYRTECEQTIAVAPVGYADGFRRTPLTWPPVLVRGQRAPIVGRVTMDQTMLDVTHIPGVRAGDEVVLIGRQGAQEVTVDDVAAALGTINYEVVSEILARVPRVV
ncbi:MAG: alanine racemase [Anaerolineae bacterium]|nr:alanine racemase [Anaerolineae bacterium]